MRAYILPESNDSGIMNVLYQDPASSRITVNIKSERKSAVQIELTDLKRSRYSPSLQYKLPAGSQQIPIDLGSFYIIAAIDLIRSKLTKKRQLKNSSTAMELIKKLTWLCFSMLLFCCNKDVEPGNVSVFFSVRINGIEFSTNSQVVNGGVINTTVCDFDCITVLMTKTAPGKNEHNIYFNFIRGQAGDYIVTRKNLTNQSGYSCPKDSVYFGTHFADDDWVMDSYHLIDDPVNHLRILRYDRSSGVIEGEFGGKFVRNNTVQKSSDAVDTLTYTQGKFLLEGLQTSDRKTGSR